MTRRLKKDIWPEMVKLPVEEAKERGVIEDWLNENAPDWHYVYHYKTSDYYFKDSNIATLFTLRWANV